ncbi:MAG: hypothetical protein LIO81_08490 [Clostridiales bacterium]|nr:hypothetical protein [Clostridiales bacterium]
MKKNVTIYLALAGCLMLSACSTGSGTTAVAVESSAVESAAADSAEESMGGSEENEENIVRGRVVSISETELVVSEMKAPGAGHSSEKKNENGEIPQRERGTSSEKSGPGAGAESKAGKEHGGAPSDRSAANENAADEPAADADDGEKSEKPENKNERTDNEKKAGGKPGDRGNGPDSDESAGETVTLVLTEQTQLVDSDESTLTISDISEGDFVKIETDGNGTALTITKKDIAETGIGGIHRSNGRHEGKSDGKHREKFADRSGKRHDEKRSERHSGGHSEGHRGTPDESRPNVGSGENVKQSGSGSGEGRKNRPERGSESGRSGESAGSGESEAANV